MEDLISVIIPVYNVENLLDRCVALLVTWVTEGWKPAQNQRFRRFDVFKTQKKDAAVLDVPCDDQKMISGTPYQTVIKQFNTLTHESNMAFFQWEKRDHHLPIKGLFGQPRTG